MTNGNTLTQAQAEAKCLSVGVKMIGRYTKSTVKTKFICPDCCKHFDSIPKNVWNKLTKRCRKCGYISNAQKRTFTRVEMDDRVKAYGFVLIGQYTNTKTKAQFRCSCGKTCEAMPHDILTGAMQSCGHCNDQKVGDCFGDLTIMEVIPNKRGRGCRIIADCKCGGVWQGRGSTLRTGRINACGCQVSRGENSVQQWLIKHDIDYVTEKTFDGCHDKHKLRFDFYMPSYGCIEYHGIQHYEEGNGYMKGKLASRQKRDSIKRQYCKDNNIKLLEIPYWDFDNIDTILTEHLTVQ